MLTPSNGGKGRPRVPNGAQEGGCVKEGDNDEG